jgi:hypothetical protein
LARADVTHNWSAASAKVEGVPWMDLPATCVFCENDQAIFLNLQKTMVSNAKEVDGAKRLKSETLNSGHCPRLSLPDSLLRIVEKIAASP